MITIAIPTMGRVEMLNSVLFSVFQQEEMDMGEILILDEARFPICEQYQVNQAIDLLSIKGFTVKIIRNRHRSGIATARTHLVSEAKGDWVFMIDDDVVLDHKCLGRMYHYATQTKYPWLVPTCVLVPHLHDDGYRIGKVCREDPYVREWVTKYPWFLNYFDYEEDFTEEMPVSGTQAILVRKNAFLHNASDMPSWFGKLPREDTYMTAKMGNGLFVSSARCYHFEHNVQQERTWDKTMFYRLHEKIMEKPDKFKEFMK